MTVNYTSSSVTCGYVHSVALTKYMCIVQSDVRPPLKVEVFHAAVAAHQDSAIICLSLLKDLAEKTASFRRIISQVLVDPSFQPWKESILDKFFLTDSSLWIGECS